MARGQSRIRHTSRTDAAVPLDLPPRSDKPDKLLKVKCWCEWKYVMVPESYVARGQTMSCGKRSCDRLHERNQPS